MADQATSRLPNHDVSSMDGGDISARGHVEVTFVTPPSTATSSTETVSTNDEDARRCEEWELFSNFDEGSRPSASRMESQRSEPSQSESETAWESANGSARTQTSDDTLEDSAELSSSTSDDEQNESETEIGDEDEEAKGALTTVADGTAGECVINQPGEDAVDEVAADDDALSFVSARENLQDEHLASSSLLLESSRSTVSTTPTNSTDTATLPLTSVTSSRIQVFVRVRPPGRGEPDTTAVKLGDSPNTIRVQSTHMSSVTECAVDRVFIDNATQEDVYGGVERGVHAALEGINATIFAYGQTGTGKTHTMFGDDTVLAAGDAETGSSVPPDWGVIPRALCELMMRTQSLRDQARAKLSCSFLQIYNDRVFDLLTDRKRQKPLIVREQPTVDGGTNVVLQGLSSEPVCSLSDALQLVQRGRVNRSVRETELNASSSRSHAIVQVHVAIEDRLPNGDKRVRTSRLNLVDLAGSEKWNTDLDMEDRHTIELKNINTSLSALGNCIAALAESGRRHIPYRDSTLTRLLQDSFGGNTLAFLIATVSPSQKATEETIRTLQFADRARTVMQVVKVNESFSGNSELLAAKAQIKQLRERITHEQRRRHETRLKEYEAMQLDFASKLQAKDEEIQRLARDNKVFAKWRAEDVARIRALEARIKDADDEAKGVYHEEQPEQNWQHDTRTARAREEVDDGMLPYQSDKRQQDNQATIAPRTPVHQALGRGGDDRRQAVERKPSMKSIMKKNKQSEGSLLPAASRNEKVEKPRVKSYRSLLEKYALPSQKGKRGEPQRESRQPADNNATASPSVSVKSPEITHERHRVEDPVASFSPEKRAPLGRSTSDTSFIGYANSVYASRHDDSAEASRLLDPPPSQSSSLLKADSLPVLAGSQQQQPWSSFAQPVQDRSDFTRVNNLNSSSDANAKQAWLLPPVVSEANAAVMTRNEPVGAVAALPETCVKHSLKGCVLCAVKDTSWTPAAPPNPSNTAVRNVAPSSTSNFSSLPKPTIQVTKPTEDTRPCGRHQLPGCFICTNRSSSSVWKTTAGSSTSSVPSVSATSSFLGASASVSGGLSMATQEVKCSTHGLANCVLCAGMTNYRPPAGGVAASSVEYTSPTKRSIPDSSWLNNQSTTSVSSSATLAPPATASAIRDRSFSSWEPSHASEPMPYRPLGQSQSLPPFGQAYNVQYTSSPAPPTNYGLTQAEAPDPGVLTSPVRTPATLSSSSSHSPALRRSINDLSGDTATRRQFNSLVREASDAANIALRRRG